MTQQAPPICFTCKHYHYARNRKRMPSDRTCKAYPDGIPKAIYYSDADHHKPYAGDRGIRYEENPNWQEEFRQ